MKLNNRFSRDESFNARPRVSDLDRLNAFTEVVTDHLTDEQFDVVCRKWKELCESRGWEVPSSLTEEENDTDR